MPPGDLSRQELIHLVERIMHGDGATEEDFDEEPTGEQVVDVALAYKPIQLGPGS